MLWPYRKRGRLRNALVVVNVLVLLAGCSTSTTGVAVAESGPLTQRSTPPTTPPLAPRSSTAGPPAGTAPRIADIATDPCQLLRWDAVPPDLRPAGMRAEEAASTQSVVLNNAGFDLVCELGEPHQPVAVLAFSRHILEPPSGGRTVQIQGQTGQVADLPNAPGGCAVRLTPTPEFAIGDFLAGAARGSTSTGEDSCQVAVEVMASVLTYLKTH